MMMKKFLFCLVAAFLLFSCEENVKTPEITGVIDHFGFHGDIYPSFNTKDVKKAGFEYGDIVKVEFEKLGTFVIPFTTAYSEVGVAGLSMCDYLERNEECTFSMFDASVIDRLGGEIGEKIKVTMCEKGGYLDIHNTVKSVYSMNRSDFSSDEVFANFREVTTNGVMPKTLYRSCNPLNPNGNTRYRYADSLAASVGIRTEIDLADTKEKIEKSIASEGYLASYCPELYRNGKVIALSMKADVFTDESLAKIADGMRFMIDNEPPYLVHCNEGKDRCGFFVMLLESLAGADVQEVLDDYMLTFINYYGYGKGDKAYNIALDMNGKRIVYLLAHPETMNHLNGFDWDSIDITDIDMHDAAVKFLLSTGLTQEEIAMLKAKISVE